MSNSLPSSISSYKPEILKIKIVPFRSWIEKRLTELLEGLEDEILFSLVFNYLEDAQKRAKREGLAANPSGGLSATEVYTALTGFLGQKVARDFVVELFKLLQEAQDSPTGLPEILAVKEAEETAFGIIEGKKKEMELSDRVRREVKRTDYYNRHERDSEYDRHRDRRYEYDERRSSDRDYDKRSDRYSDRHRENRDADYHRHRDSDYHRHRDSEHYRHRESDHHRSSRYYERDIRDREYDRNDRDHSYRSSRRHSRSPSRNSPQRHQREYPRSKTSTRSPIPSSSSSSSESPSPCWETFKDASIQAAPRAPDAREHVPNELEQALRAKALQAQKK